MNIAALVSGGVDSSVVVHLLKEQGYTPDIFYIRIGMEDEEGYIDCPAEEDIEITQWIAKKYGCRFEEVNLHKEYWDNVVSYTIESVRKGLTPNPDVMCNKLIKFGAFDDKRGHDYDRIATGHYARVETTHNMAMSSTRPASTTRETWCLSPSWATSPSRWATPHVSTRSSKTCGPSSNKASARWDGTPTASSRSNTKGKWSGGAENRHTSRRNTLLIRK